VDHQTSARSRRRPRIAALSLCAVALLTTGCGSGSDADGVTPQDAPSTALTIKVTGGDPAVWKLTCDPAGGDHPDAEAACAALAKSGAKSIPATPADALCTAMFGGEQTAVITGTWRGQAVDARFSRQNGCEIDRWNDLVPLLPKASRVGVQ